MLEALWDLAFGSLYGGLITVIALLAAIPYGIWQGLLRVKRLLWRESDGNAGTGS